MRCQRRHERCSFTRSRCADATTSLPARTAGSTAALHGVGALNPSVYACQKFARLAELGKIGSIQTKYTYVQRLAKDPMPNNSEWFTS